MFLVVIQLGAILAVVILFWIQIWPKKKKNFSVGLRIEHLQTMINESQYGTKTKLKLPPAEYKLAYHGKDGRSCYTFCMCPGGEVIASSSEKGTIVVNGMSTFSRNGINANSAILVNITPEDVGKGENPLKGIEFQRKLEEAAFKLGGSNYYAPIQRVEDFINNIKSDIIGEIKPGESQQFSTSATFDYANAYDFEITKK